MASNDSFCPHLEGARKGAQRRVWASAGVGCAMLAVIGFTAYPTIAAISPGREATTAGFERVEIPVVDGHVLQGAFWYPSTSATVKMSLGLTEQIVAANGIIVGQDLPLVVISHGAFGTWHEHSDTAAALARAGFVVAGLTHDDFSSTGALKLVGRSQQLTRLIDYALRGWRGAARVKAEKIGVFGFSIGGFTALVAAGGRPDKSRLASHCLAAPAEWSCALAARHRLDFANTPPPPGSWLADWRIKAAVIAAPALGYVFGQAGLASVQIPIQLWQAGADATLSEPWNVQAVRQDLPRPPEYHLVPGADHGDFGAPCSPAALLAAPSLCRDASGLDRAAFHAAFNAAVVAFFNEKLGAGPATTPRPK